MKAAFLALALPVAGAAQAERTDYRTGLPSDLGAISTGLPTFVACPDYLAHHQAARIEAEARPGAALDCEIAHLLSLAEPFEGEAPDPCAVIDAAVQRLDLRSFPNGLRPRLDGSGPVALDALLAPQFAPYCGGAVASDGDHSVGVTALAAGDWTGDGAADALVVLEERIATGTYLSVAPLVLTGLAGEVVTGLPVCAFLGGGPSCGGAP